MTALNVAPAGAINYPGHGCDIEPVVARDGGKPIGGNDTRCAASVPVTDGNNIRRRQLRGRVSFSAQARLNASTLANHVLGVVCHRAQKQMSRVNAGGRVAGMTDAEPLRDRAMGQLPRHAMSVTVLALHSEASVSVLVAGADPEPACAGLVDLGPKPLSNVCHSVSMP